MTNSIGQQLFTDIGLKQGTYFLAKIIPEVHRNQWIDSRSQAKFRILNKSTKIGENYLLVITSQDCDITCSDNIHDNSIELAVFKAISPSKAHAGNKFVKSVRKLHINLDEQWYEAKVEHIITIEKQQLKDLITDKKDILILPDIHKKAIPIWRANRYFRTALPNNFNNQFIPIFDEYLSLIEASADTDDEKSYLRALYICLDSYEEEPLYIFSFFGLLREDTPNNVLSSTQDAIEAMSDALVENTGYTEREGNYADRDSSTFVSFLSSLVRINLDHLSLKDNDDETGSELPIT